LALAWLDLVWFWAALMRAAGIFAAPIGAACSRSAMILFLTPFLVAFWVDFFPLTSYLCSICVYFDQS
jgi:hypothetical protein